MDAIADLPSSRIARGARLCAALSLLLCLPLQPGCNSDNTSSQGSNSNTGGGGGGGGGKDKDAGGTSKGWNAAVGGGGTFLQTFDGQSWQRRVLGSEDLLSVSCVSYTLGWAAGDLGLVARTQDAGASFQRLQTGTTAALLAVRFAEDGSSGTAGRLGLAAGDGGTLLLSRDGGDSFGAVATGVSRALRGVAVARAGHLLLAVGDGGVVLRSTDGGQGWSRQALTGDLAAVAAGVDGRLVIAAGAGLWESQDSGATFQRVGGADAGGIASVSLRDDGFALAAGPGGRAWLRDPIGSWRPLDSGVAEDLHAALLTGDGLLYLAGAGGMLLLSTDLGRSFLRVPDGTDATLYGMEAF